METNISRLTEWLPSVPPYEEAVFLPMKGPKACLKAKQPGEKRKRNQDH